jgi:hypothetical protein
MAKTGAFTAIMPRDPALFYRGLLEAPEAASQTYKRGAIVLGDAAGRIAEVAATPTSILGIAANDGQNGTAGQYNALYYPIRPGDQFEITLLETLAQTQLFDTDAGVVKDGTTSAWYASTADGGAQVRIIDYIKGPGGWDIGDTKARVLVIFHTTKLELL